MWIYVCNRGVILQIIGEFITDPLYYGIFLCLEQLDLNQHCYYCHLLLFFAHHTNCIQLLHRNINFS